MARKKVERKLVAASSGEAGSKRRGNQFDYSEVYRQLRTNIEFSSFENDIKVLNVTSTTPAEGKSSVISNLAIISAAKYKNVLLIDCDLRKPVQHKIFKVSNRFGVSDLTRQVASYDPEDESYFQKFKGEGFEGKLYLLPSGSKVPNPQELLSSDKFARLIEKLKEKFEFIIIDCPPVSAVSDAIPVSNICDGTLFVCSAKETNKNDAKSALTQLQRNGANVIGCVLTKVEDTSEYKYGYYYSND